MEVSDRLHTPAALLPEKDTRYPLYRRLGGPQIQSEPVAKMKDPCLCW